MTVSIPQWHGLSEKCSGCMRLKTLSSCQIPGKFLEATILTCLEIKLCCELEKSVLILCYGIQNQECTFKETGKMPLGEDGVMRAIFLKQKYSN